MDKTLNFIGYLLCLLPVAILTGPLLSDSIVSIIALVFIFNTLKYKNWHYLNNSFFYFFLFFYLYILIRSFFSDHILISLESSFFYFRFIFFALGVWLLLDHKKNFLYLFTYVLLFAFFVCIIDGYYQYFSRINSVDGIGHNLFGFVGVQSRLTLLLSNELVLGSYLSRLFPLLIGLLILLYPKNKLFILFSLVVMVAIDVLVFLSGERTALALMVLSTVLIVGLVSKLRLLRIIAFILSFLSIIFITIYDEDIKERNINKTIQQLNLDGSSDEEVFFSTEHDSIMKTAIEIFQNNPIFGVGPKLFRVECQNIDGGAGCSTHPHNSYIQLLAETGIVGFMFMVVLLIRITYYFIKHLYLFQTKQKTMFTDYQICLLICFYLSLWPIVPTVNIFNNWINIIYFLPIGFFLHSFKFNKK